nr:PREDICTED: zinc-binding protein A33-like [Latimeria chalumnae]|eukprot:XP_014353098.1 PREDICTED: zinc-binding protein A33-like [Latimeria chalumnae]
MASKATNDIPEEDLTCSICREIFTDPVTLQCGHYFCQKCVCEHWKQTDTQSCPVCRAFCSKTDLKINITLLKIVDALKKKPKAQPEGICSEHEEKLKLFCLEDQELICVVCQTSKKHQNHKCCPIKEAASECKKDVKTSLTSLQDTEKKLIKVKEEYNKYLKHILDQTEKTKKQIKESFVKLHQFLHEEEWNLLADLKKEAEGKGQKMREKIKKDILLLMDLQDVKKRAFHIYKEPETIPSGTLINVAKYLGNLQHRAWKKMLSIINSVAVTLDPNTANSSLTLSENLTSVQFCTQKNLPLNPERFSPAIAVLGYKGFTSGRHSRVVDVGNKTEWILGVTKELINRKGQIYLSPKYGCWTIVLRNGREYVAYTDRETQLKLEKKPKKVWISLDYEDGEVSFYNADDMKEIYTFKDHFTEKLYPLFSPSDNRDGKNSEPLRICPLYVAVVEQ